MSEKQAPIRLEEFRVSGLFGEFNHNIPLKSTDRVTAVIAPNGMGKTVCLRLINAMFSRQWNVFSSSDFVEAKYIFSNGAQIRAVRSNSAESEEDPSTFIAPYKFYIKEGPELQEITWTPTIDIKALNLANQIERFVPFVTRTGPLRWTHDRTGVVYNSQAIVEAYSERLPLSVKHGLISTLPEPLRKLIDCVDCHLIETQRLLIIDEEDNMIYRNDRGKSARYAIQEKAQKLKNIISDQLTNYATLSQSLDRSFPRRVIASSAIRLAENLKLSLSELDHKRRMLMEVGILDTEGDEPVALPPGPIEPAIARVLSVYVGDTTQKLQSLDTILSRIQLFQELIEGRFRNKEIKISKNVGFSVAYNGNEVPLDKLSSGEQHQLVLFFELLFELKENALILIDEPELSLHVSWQKRFIADLERIIGLNNFDVVLATHSPQLIGRWNNLVVELGEVGE